VTGFRVVATLSGSQPAPLSDPVARVGAKLAQLRLSPANAVALALLLTSAAAYGDAVTTAATTFTLFYVIALMVAVWFAGIRAGYAVAIAAVVGNTIAGAQIVPQPALWYFVWNAVLDLALYAAFIHLLGALRQRLQQEMAGRQDALGQLRHAERLTTLGRLASGIAHEIGTPLNVISGRAELIASGTLDGDAVVTSANIVVAQTERITVIIRQLLDFARKGGTRVERTDLTSLVEHTSMLLGPLASRAGVQIVCRGEHAEADVNRPELQQVITNLITNAVHAMPGGGKIEVSVTTETARDPRRGQAPPRSYAVVRVQDHGVGIAPETLPRIFEPFFTTRDVGVGTGLGLSVVFGIVQDHGGWIAVDTTPGEGTTMSVYLPKQLE
jgi:signal transduction histidine kinase